MKNLRPTLEEFFGEEYEHLSFSNANTVWRGPNHAIWLYKYKRETLYLHIQYVPMRSLRDDIVLLATKDIAWVKLGGKLT